MTQDKKKEEALQALRKQTQDRFATLFEPEKNAVLEAAMLAPDTTSFESLDTENLTAVGRAMDGVRLLVDSPDKWPEAKDIKYQWTFQALQGLLAFDLRAISQAEESEIVGMVPRVEKGNKSDEEFQREQQMFMAQHVVLTLERGWGKEFPGKTAAEKVAWIENQLAGQAGVYTEMNAAIQALSGYGTMPMWLIPRDASGRTSAVVDREKPATTVAISDPEAWAKIAVGKQMYRIHRAGITYEWPTVPVPTKIDREISQQTSDPDPPQIVQYAPGTGRPTGSKPDPNDSAYVATLERNMRLRQMLHIEAALPFDIPGANADEKCAWLAQRPAGDVDALYKFVTVDLHNLGLATDFF